MTDLLSNSENVVLIIFIVLLFALFVVVQICLVNRYQKRSGRLLDIQLQTKWKNKTMTTVETSKHGPYQSQDRILNDSDNDLSNDDLNEKGKEKQLEEVIIDSLWKKQAHPNFRKKKSEHDIHKAGRRSSRKWDKEMAKSHSDTFLLETSPESGRNGSVDSIDSSRRSSKDHVERRGSKDNLKRELLEERRDSKDKEHRRSSKDHNEHRRKSHDHEHRRASHDKEERRGSKDKEHRRASHDKEERRGSKDKEHRRGSHDKEERRGSKDKEHRKSKDKERRRSSQKDEETRMKGKKLNSSKLRLELTEKESICAQLMEAHELLNLKETEEIIVPRIFICPEQQNQQQNQPFKPPTRDSVLKSITEKSESSKFSEITSTWGQKTLTGSHHQEVLAIPGYLEWKLNFDFRMNSFDKPSTNQTSPFYNFYLGDVLSGSMSEKWKSSKIICCILKNINTDTIQCPMEGKSKEVLVSYSFYQQISALHFCQNHQTFIKFFGYDEANRILLLKPYPLGSLKTLLDLINERPSFLGTQHQTFLQMVENYKELSMGLQWLHEHGLSLGSIRTESIFLEEKEATEEQKIEKFNMRWVFTDFSICQIQSEIFNQIAFEPVNAYGKWPIWTPPEVYKLFQQHAKESQKPDQKKIDIYCMSFLLNHLLTRQSPFSQ